MARRKRRYTRTRTVYRTVRSRSRSLFGAGAFKNILNGVIGGAVIGFVPDDAVFGFGDALALSGIGWFTGDRTLQTLGGMMLGEKLLGRFPGGGSSSGDGWL